MALSWWNLVICIVEFDYHLLPIQGPSELVAGVVDCTIIIKLSSVMSCDCNLLACLPLNQVRPLLSFSTSSWAVLVYVCCFCPHAFPFPLFFLGCFSEGHTLRHLLNRMWSKMNLRNLCFCCHSLWFCSLSEIYHCCFFYFYLPKRFCHGYGRILVSWASTICYPTLYFLELTLYFLELYYVEEYWWVKESFLL